MALKSIIYKVNLQVSDMDRSYYGQHALTVARHPSETDERMMVRLLAFACHGGDALEFGRGISQDDEPDLWEKDLTGVVKLWIEVGLPSERRIRKASGLADTVVVYTYGGRAVDIWLADNRASLDRLKNLYIVNLPAASAELAVLAKKTMDIQCTIQEGQVWLSDADQTVQLELQNLIVPAGR